KTFNYRTGALTSPDLYSQPYAVVSGREGTTPFLKTAYTYDFNTGLAKSVTRPNGLTTNYFYDAAWRANEVDLPSGAKNFSSVDKDANGNDQLAAVQQLYYAEGTSPSLYITTKSWFNGAGQVLRTGSAAGSAPTGYDAVETRYDSWGRVLKQ